MSEEMKNFKNKIVKKHLKEDKGEDFNASAKIELSDEQLENVNGATGAVEYERKLYRCSSYHVFLYDFQSHFSKGDAQSCIDFKPRGGDKPNTCWDCENFSLFNV